MKLAAIAIALTSLTVFGSEHLIRFNADDAASHQAFFASHGGRYELVSAEGNLYRWITNENVDEIFDSSVGYIQDNHVYSIFQSPSLIENRSALIKAFQEKQISVDAPMTDNPDIQSPMVQASGGDTEFSKMWGLPSIGGVEAWKKAPQGKGIVVAVTDTGVDYNHPDLINNMWRNKGETAGDGIDNDGNGFIDDVVGWDFATNDNKPYDLSLDLMAILFQGGNPGHGTHVAGVVAASANNGQGIAGVAPQAKIMAMRFITEKGKGSAVEAIKAVDYAVANGANVINASWGGEAGDEEDKALIECIKRAEAKGVLFIAAAGNGRQGVGFDNDADKKPMVPSSFDNENIIAVAAVDSSSNIGKFSNWGAKSVDIGAPGVKILSTVPGGKYQDTIIDMGSIKATWDGTSMAAPHVAGATALLWSAHPNWKAGEVKNEVLKLVTATPDLSSKTVTGGRLDLRGLR